MTSLHRTTSAVGLLCLAGIAMAQPLVTVDRAAVGRMPASVDLVAAVGDLSQMRETPAGHRLESLLNEVSSWNRTAAAWDAVANAMGLSREAASDQLLGNRVMLAIRGLESSGPAEHAMLSEVSRETEALLRSRLRPAPRGVSSGVPLLSLESGAFELSTSIDQHSGATVLISPRDSTSLFDELLPQLRGGANAASIDSSPWWKHVKALPESPMLLIFRQNAKQDVNVPSRTGELPESDEPFFAFAATISGPQCTGEFIASQSMLLDAPLAPQPRAWPAPVLTHLSEGALLLIAGAPDEQPRGEGVFSGAASSGTMLVSILDSLGLPQDLRREIDGVTVAAIHRVNGGVSTTAVLPMRDIAAAAVRADDWILSLAGDGEERIEAGERVATAGIGQVRMLKVGSAADAPAGHMRAGGSVSWTFSPAADPANPSGWWIINFRSGGSSDYAGASDVEALGLACATEFEATDDVYSLTIRPAELTELLRRSSRTSEQPIVSPELAARGRTDSGVSSAARKPPFAAREQSDTNPMRWLDRVETRVKRGNEGTLSGRLTVRLNDLN